MTRKEDLQQFFISANDSQDRPDFDLEAFTKQYLQRNSDEPLILSGISTPKVKSNCPKCGKYNQIVRHDEKIASSFFCGEKWAV